MNSYNESRLQTEPENLFTDNSINENQFKPKNKTFYLETYGCQMNENDSEIICTILEKNNYLRKQNPEEVTIFLFKFN